MDSVLTYDVRHGPSQHSGCPAGGQPYCPLEEREGMSILSIGLLYGASTLLVMFAGMPIAFALGAVATIFMIAFMPSSSVDTITQNVYEEMASITLLAIPLFILKGSAIGRSRAGQDLYGALHAWLHRIPGGLGIANVFACALFAAMAGSSPATCSAIGSAGIPEMRKGGCSWRRSGRRSSWSRCSRSTRCGSSGRNSAPPRPNSSAPASSPNCCAKI